ncbi:MAG: hypothetical protein CVU38_06950 [Chloroflexi bacterium HGW-Chloroflexi-1]|nr:MAG: hypothetical protein CVU38_06950 [Chloroflexi bacterium HGW-Chloroflexi-1]
MIRKYYNMTQCRDPLEIYREALASIPVPTEERPPAIERAEVWPYPELARLWVRVETGPFAAFPNLELVILDPAGQPVSQMFMVEIRQPYQSLTMHLRQPPRPGERYRLEITLSRNEETLDTRTVEFEMVFREPEGK